MDMYEQREVVKLHNCEYVPPITAQVNALTNESFDKLSTMAYILKPSKSIYDVPLEAALSNRFYIVK